MIIAPRRVNFPWNNQFGVTREIEANADGYYAGRWFAASEPVKDTGEFVPKIGFQDQGTGDIFFVPGKANAYNVITTMQVSARIGAKEKVGGTYQFICPLKSIDISGAWSDSSVSLTIDSSDKGFTGEIVISGNRFALKVKTENQLAAMNLVDPATNRILGTMWAEWSPTKDQFQKIKDRRTGKTDRLIIFVENSLYPKGSRRVLTAKT